MPDDEVILLTPYIVSDLTHKLINDQRDLKTQSPPVLLCLTESLYFYSK